MKNVTLKAIEKVTNGKLILPEGYELSETEAKGVVIDSRQVEENFVFVAIPGERVDGHNFVNQVLEKGALCCIVEREIEDAKGPLVLVEKSTIALARIAQFYREQLEIPVVGITGSVGKTSTKEMIATVLSEKYNVLKTEGNFNNEIGLPLTICRIKDEHEVAVVEMGISGFGEMNRLSIVAKPTIQVITNIGTCHLENLGDRDGVFRAKTECFPNLSGEKLVVLNGDDDKLIAVEKVDDKAPLFYGMNAGGKNTVYPVSVENKGLEGCVIKMQFPDGEVKDVTISIPGNHNIYNACAAAGVGSLLGLTKDEIVSGIAKAKTISGRMNMIKKDGYIVIDDCYNANPVSMKASLDVLALATGRKIAVLGDMGELGENEKQLHYEVGSYGAGKGIDKFYLCGELSKEILSGLKNSNDGVDASWFESKDELIEALKKEIKAGDGVLVKASHFMEYGKIVESLVK